MDDAAIRDLLTAQDGVIARRQVLAAGGGDHDVERMLFQRRWTRVDAGVYVAHTGPLSFRERAWAAVLLHAPAALAGQAALAIGRPGGGGRTWEPSVIDLVVARHRRVVDPPGVPSAQRRRGDRGARGRLPDRQDHTGPAARARGAAPADQAPQAGRRGAGRPRRWRQLRAGRRYLRDVERAHGLPTGIRQRRVVAGTVTASGTWTIRTFARSSSSTADWGTTGRRTAGTTSSET